MAITNVTNYKLKIDYATIKNNPTIGGNIPLPIMARAKIEGYIYFNDLNPDIQYRLAVMLLQDAGIIHYNTENKKIVDLQKLPFITGGVQIPLEEVPRDELINYFIKYNVLVENLLVTVYEKEYVVQVEVPSVFMDVLHKNLNQFQTDIDQFILSVYRKYIQIPKGTIPFIPWFGTNIKLYLHQLSVHQAAEMLQAELNGLTKLLKNFFLNNNILDIDFTATVEVITNSEYGNVVYQITIEINGKHYTIHVI